MKPDFSAAIANYHHKSFRRWLMIAGICSIATLTLIGCMQTRQCIRYMQYKQAHNSLAAQFTANKRKWSLQQKNRQKLNRLRKQYALLAKQPRIDTVLIATSQAIGPHTFLISIEFKAPLITIEGYAPNTEELMTYVTALTNHPQNGAKAITLIHAHNEPAGVSFTIEADLALS